MKRIITTLLLAALMLQPALNASAQNIELSQSVMETIQMLPDSLRSAAFRQAMGNEIAQAGEMRSYHTTLGDVLEDVVLPIMEDVVLPIIIIGSFFAACVLIVFRVRKSKEKREAERNALISKMVDSGVFATANAGSADMLQALMPQKKTEKDKIIADASCLGLGIGICVFYFIIKSKLSGVADLIALGGLILIGFGLIRLIARGIIHSIEKKKEKDSVR